MFRELKNIETAFRHIRTFSIVFICVCTVICGLVVYKSFQLAAQSGEHVYILANGKALEAFTAGRKDNIAVEARDHIYMFHSYFFSLDPDDKVIRDHITKALYLADNSASKLYGDLKEQSYYANLIAGNISQQLIMDSIQVSLDHYPYYFKFYGSEKMIRSTSIVTRSLITEGYLRNVARSDNNSHGFLIEKWNVLENKELRTENR